MVKNGRVNTVDRRNSVEESEYIFVDAINGITFSALVDTGCFSSMLMYDTFIKLGEIGLRKEKQRLYEMKKVRFQQRA